MSAAKQKMEEIIQDQPDDSTYDEILKELVFARMIEKGLDDSRKGKSISNDEMRRRMSGWQK